MRASKLVGVSMLVAASLVAVAAQSRPAGAADSERVLLPGVTLRSFTRGDPAGPQEIRVLRFRLDNPRISIRPVLAAEFGARLLRPSDLAVRSGALATVNGDFYTADCNVRGAAVVNGIMHSEPEAPINGAATPRAAWRVDAGTLAFGRPGSQLRWGKTGSDLGLNGIERSPGYLGNPDESVLVTPGFAATSATPVGGVDVVLDHLDPLRADTPLTPTVSSIRSGPGPIPAGGGVVSATGAAAAQVSGAGLVAGDTVSIDLHVDDPAFSAATTAGGGGPWVVHDGAPVPRDAMLGEGFSASHIDLRAPRTAIGRTADGTVLLVTVDGRQAGRSVGASLPGLADILIELGAVEAVSLDGGGSTTMVAEGRVQNVPSGEDAVTKRAGVEPAVPEAVGVFYSFTPTVTRRVAGDDRIATAIALSHERTSSGTVVVATSTGFADALVGGPLAASLGAPVLLTGPAGLDPRVVAEIRRLGATNAIVLGGAAALTSQVDADLAGAGVTSVRRVAGADRYATGAAVAAELPSAEPVLIASGERFPDALAAGALGLPVLLSSPTGLPAASVAALGSHTAVVVGGSAAIDASVLPGAERVAGADRYGTSAAVADWGIAHGRYDAAEVLVARADDFPDALVSGPFRRPLLLVERTDLDLSPPTRDWLVAHGATTGAGVVLGGTAAVSTKAEIQLDDALAPGTNATPTAGDLVVAPATP